MVHRRLAVAVLALLSTRAFAVSWAHSHENLNGEGTPLWSRAYRGDFGAIMFRAAVAMPDGGIAVTGMGDLSGVALPIAPDGAIKWQSGFEISGRTELAAIAATRDGGVLVGGRAGPAGFAAKLDANGALVWHRTIGAKHDLVQPGSQTTSGRISVKEPTAVPALPLRSQD